MESKRLMAGGSLKSSRRNGVTALCAAALLAAAGLSPARAGETAWTIFDEDALGRSYLASAFWRLGWRSLGPDARLERVAGSVGGLAELRGIRLRPLRADTDVAGAWSFSDGTIVLTSGLLERAAPTDTDLLVILSHEAAHVVLRHTVAEEAMRRASDAVFEEMREAFSSSQGGAEGETQGENTAEIARRFESLDDLEEAFGPFLEASLLRLQRQQELQADHLGLLLALQAGAGSNDVLGCLDRMAAALGEPGAPGGPLGVFGITSGGATHPSWALRRAAIVDFLDRARVAHTRFGTGLEALHLGAWPDAAAEFRAVVEAVPTSRAAALNLSCALLHQYYDLSGLPLDGIPEIAWAPAPDRVIVEAARITGVLGVRGPAPGREVLDEADTVLERAFAMAPWDAEVANNLGAVLLEKGEHRLAGEIFAAAAANGLDPLRARRNLGLLLCREFDAVRRTGSPEQAVRVAAEALPVLRSLLREDASRSRLWEAYAASMSEAVGPTSP